MKLLRIKKIVLVGVISYMTNVLYEEERHRDRITETVKKHGEGHVMTKTKIEGTCLQPKTT